MTTTTHWALQHRSLFGNWETKLRFRYRWTARAHFWLFGYNPDRYRLMALDATGAELDGRA